MEIDANKIKTLCDRVRTRYYSGVTFKHVVLNQLPISRRTFERRLEKYTSFTVEEILILANVLKAVD